MKELVKKDRILEYDIMRVIAVILVLIGHATYLSCYSNFGGVVYKISDLSSFYKFLSNNIVHIIYIFHMPLFVFLSGALYYKKNINEDSENIVIQKFKRYIVPYIVYGIMYNIVIKLFSGFYVLKNIPYVIIFEVIMGKNVTQHIWFLATLFYVTILFFLIFKIGVKKDYKKLFFIIIILSFFQRYCEFTLPGAKYVVLLFLFFSLGILFEKNRLKIEEECKNYNFLYLIIFGIISVILYLVNDAFNIIFISSFVEVLLISAIIMTIYFFANVISSFKLIKNSLLMKVICKYSFDIYILGDPLNYIVLFLVYQLGLNELYKTSQGTVIIFLVRTVGIMIISILLAKIVNYFKSLRYFKKIITATIMITILMSIFCITYNSINKIKVEKVVYEVSDCE